MTTARRGWKSALLLSPLLVACGAGGSAGPGGGSGGHGGGAGSAAAGSSGGGTTGGGGDTTGNGGTTGGGAIGGAAGATGGGAAGATGGGGGAAGGAGGAAGGAGGATGGGAAGGTTGGGAAGSGGVAGAGGAGGSAGASGGGGAGGSGGGARGGNGGAGGSGGSNAPNLRFEYMNSSATATMFSFRVTNLGPSMPLISSLRARYYFSDDAGRNATPTVTSAQWQIASASSMINLRGTGGCSADASFLTAPKSSYIDVGCFLASPMNAQDTVTIAVAVDPATQLAGNDYSYADTGGAFAANDHVMLFVNGVATSGTPPP